MPRDARLYMTFPIDFHRHPKITKLSLEARWAFIEMNGEARAVENDGRFTREEAEFHWPETILDELIRSHPTRPLVVLEGDTYVIRDYAQHQFTKADRDELHQKRSEAGRLGAAKKASAKQVLSKRQDLQSTTEAPEQQTEAEIGIGTGKGIPTPKGVGALPRAHSVPKNFSITPAMREWAKTNAPLVDIDAKLPEFIDYWRGVGKPMKDWVAVWHNGMRKQQEFALRDQAKAAPVVKLKVPKNEEWMWR